MLILESLFKFKLQWNLVHAGGKISCDLHERETQGTCKVSTPLICNGIVSKVDEVIVEIRRYPAQVQRVQGILLTCS